MDTKIEHDHANHHEMMARDFKRRFFIALVVAIPLLALSPTIQQWFGFSLPEFPGQNFLLFGLASVIALYVALPFYTGAVSEIRSGRWGMMTLVSLAVLSGYIYSAATTFFIDAPGFYWEISTLVLVLLLGHWLEMRAVVGTSGALRELVKLIPPTANRVLKDGGIKEVETSVLKKGDTVLVKSGAKVPIDGIVIEGASHVNEAMITGESKPVAKQKGNEVIGGTINGEGSLTVRGTKTGEDTALSQIIELVRKTQASKPKTQRLADKAAHYLTIIAIVVGVLTFVVWNFIFAQGFLFALTLTITVVVITCPHALGLAIPTVTTITTTKAARNGILIRDMEGLERARTIDYIIFDKTGTLTRGEPKLTGIFPVSIDKRELLEFAYSLDKNSTHPLSLAVVKESEEANIKPREVEDFKQIVGRGVRAKIGTEYYFLGNYALMKEQGVELDDKIKQEVKAHESKAETAVMLAQGSNFLGYITFRDEIRTEAKEAMRQLKSMGIRPIMLTGDNTLTAKVVAEEIGIREFLARVRPEEKLSKIKELQGEGKIVAMVGDGVNDAPALIQSDVGVAIGAGTDVAVESAEIVLIKNNPLDIVKLITLSRKTMAKMKQNLVWATGYNLIAIPVAAGILYPWGVILRPEWGALAMTASSIIVVLNALLLKRATLT